MAANMSKEKNSSPIPAPKILWNDTPRANQQTEGLYKFEEGEETLETFLGDINADEGEPEDASHLLSDFSQLPYPLDPTKRKPLTTPARPVVQNTPTNTQTVFNNGTQSGQPKRPYVQKIEVMTYYPRSANVFTQHYIR